MECRRDAWRGDADPRRTGAVRKDEGLFLLPGTHSKWAEVRGRRIVSFRTFMTGEVFGALKGHTILGRLMRDGAFDPDAFARGVHEGATLGSAGALLNRIFATRSYGLMDKLRDAALSDYLSGLLIGAEIVEATRQAKSAVTIIASAALARRYTDALKLLGHGSTLARKTALQRPSPDCPRSRTDLRKQMPDLRGALNNAPSSRSCAA